MKKGSFLSACLIGIGICFSGVASAKYSTVLVLGAVASAEICKAECNKSDNTFTPICKKIKDITKTSGNTKCVCSCKHF